jgi:hypothetical protein
MKFVTRHYTLPVQRLCTSATAALVSAADLEVYASARMLLEQARQQAAQFVQQARDEAEADIAALRQQEQAAQAARHSEGEQQHWLLAQQLETHYQDLRQKLTQNLEPLLDQALAHALRQLTLQIDPIERLRAVTAALAHYVPDPTGATLWISAKDTALLATLGKLPWTVEILVTLPAGHCSLVGPGGAWQCDFDTLLSRFPARR